MSFIQWVVVGLIAYVCLYSLVSRICQCIEQYITAKYIIQFMKPEDIEKIMED